MKFRNNNFIKEKIYFLNYIVNNLNKRLVTLIIHNENTFLANNN